jgi:SET domain
LETGYCLDNMKPDQSNIQHAGRGAFATRYLEKGQIVAPVPVLPITRREALDITRVRQTGPNETTESTTAQLLLNYCYGSPKSSVLLFPYSPMVNLINHHSPYAGKPSNVKLQWFNASSIQHISLQQLEQSNTHRTSSLGGMLLELVATKDIKEGDEILLDYGAEWQSAWDQHAKNWESYPFDYAPAKVMDESAPILGTQEEVQASTKPYPPNMVTSCFYPYIYNEKSVNNARNNITRDEWKPFPGIFELRWLRPCTIMQRVSVNADKEDDQDPANYYYTVVIRNRYGLAPHERIPAGHMHVVTRLPRRAIRFTDKIYTTDQHLLGAFRKEIGLGDDIFPTHWMYPEANSEAAANA